ncbi:MAG: exodeoxyribonuclease VII small subunit [Paludibacter sp.]|jgi:exodeoxyribonuclease VII small subunit
MSKQKPTYTEALTELEQILSELENDKDLNMDVVAEKVKKAALLLEICKKQLHEIDKDIEKIMDQID